MDEKIYNIDRMLTQLKPAGVFDKLSGIVFGKCVKSDPSKTTLSLSLENVFDEIFTSLSIPVYSGAMIGHIDRGFIEDFVLICISRNRRAIGFVFRISYLNYQNKSN